MNENAQASAPAAQRLDPTAVVQHIADRSAQLGLSEPELARQAGMAPAYLRHLLVAGVDFDPGAFLRIAAALHLTYRELLEGPSDPPAGQSRPAPRPVLIRLTAPECWEKLGARGVGRIALPVQPGPAVFPVNYTVDAETIVYRTAPQGAAAPEPGTAVSFQADRIDDHLSNGWSVLITGTAEHLDDPETIQRLTEEHASEPWAGGGRPLWIRVRPDRITGRQVGTM